MILYDPPGRQISPHGIKNRQEILTDPLFGYNSLHPNQRQVILGVAQASRDFLTETKTKKTKFRDNPSGRTNPFHKETRKYSSSGERQEKFLEPPDTISRTKKTKSK